MEKAKPQTKPTHRLILFPAPFSGHINPMLHLASLLHSNGFSITIIQTHYNSLNPHDYPHFSFYTMDVLQEYSESPNVDSFVVISAMKSCSESFRECLSEILAEGNGAQQRSVAALIMDPMWDFAGSVADGFKVTKMALRTGNMSALPVYCSLSLLRERGYFKDDKPDEPILEFPPLTVSDLPSESVHHILEAVVENTRTSQGVICNTFEELESSAISTIQQTLNIPIFPIGPLHKHLPTSTINTKLQDQTSITWLNTQQPKSVLYVSFGSVANMTHEEFLELAWGILKSEVPFLWVVRAGLIQGSEQPKDPFPEGYIEMIGKRGCIVKWAPQLEVLAHPSVGGFWTHNGWNSTLESICEGVPMICQPLFADQRMNARQVSQNWMIGVKVEKGVKREEIARVIRKVMLEEEGEEMRKRITILKEKADVCLKEGGSSYMSLKRLTDHLLSI